MGKYYGGRPQMPPRDVLVGQDLIRHQQQQHRQVGPVAEGLSTDLMLCIVDPRQFPKETRTITRDLRRLNCGIPSSRAVDQALLRHEPADRSVIGGLLVQLHYAIWEIRTGEISCNDIHDMFENVKKFSGQFWEECYSQAAFGRGRRH